VEPAPAPQAEPAPETQAEPAPETQAEPAQALPTQTAPETQAEPAPETQAEPAPEAQAQPAAQAETVNARLSMAGPSLSSRLVIFSAAFLAVEERPLTLLIGELREPAMVRSARLINIPVQNHLHNSFLQTLAVGGGVTLLFVLALTALLVINAFRLFLCYGAPLPTRLLTLLPAGLLCHAMIEALLFVDMRPPNLLFFLIAGMVMAYAAELCPAKRAARKAQTGGAADV
jgi:O-antigen ligase